jgi:hypothetical protein
MAGRSELASEVTDAMGGLGGAISLDDLFPERWMDAHTDAESIDAFILESDFDVESPESFRDIPDYEWDRYVASRSEFEDWSEMVSAALEEYLSNVGPATSTDAAEAAHDAADG